MIVSMKFTVECPRCRATWKRKALVHFDKFGNMKLSYPEELNHAEHDDVLDTIYHETDGHTWKSNCPDYGSDDPLEQEIAEKDWDWGMKDE